MFPRIEHIDDLLSRIEGRKEFKHWDKGDYQVIDYVVQRKNTFHYEEAGEMSKGDTRIYSYPNPYLLECRGIKFDKEGEILARPLHKFFNLNEKSETELGNVDWTQNFVLYEKYDGSMIHPALLNDRWFLMTRSGITPHSEWAESLLRPIDYDFFDYCAKAHLTPIYEWIGPDNQHIVKYKENQLKLLAIRRNVSGTYLDHQQLEIWKPNFDLNIAEVHETVDPVKTIEKLKEVKNFEGYVYYFPATGFRIKVKGPEYVLAHRAKSAADFEGRILEMIFENRDDDFYAILEEEQQKKFDEYKEDVWNRIDELCRGVKQSCHYHCNLSRKEFAQKILFSLPRCDAHFYFKYRDLQEGKLNPEKFDLKEYVVNTLLRFVKGKNLDKAKELLRVEWPKLFTESEERENPLEKNQQESN